MRFVDDEEAFDFDGFAVGLTALLPGQAPAVQCDLPTGRKVMRESIGDDYHRAAAFKHHIFPWIANDSDPANWRPHNNCLSSGGFDFWSTHNHFVLTRS